jgi:hypothetical protein
VYYVQHKQTVCPYETDFFFFCNQYCNGKYVDFCGTQQTGAAQEGKPAPKNPY